MRLFLALCIVLMLFSCNLTTTTRQNSGSSRFDEIFQQGALRVDIVLRDSMPYREVNIVSVTSLNDWTGRRGDIYEVDNHPMGNFVYYIVDEKSRDTIWTDGFCALYEEWVNTQYEGKTIIDYEHTIYAPMPRGKSTLVIEQRARNGVYTEVQRLKIDPREVKPCNTILNPTVKCLNDAGDPHTSLDFLILADAYKAEDESKFDTMAQAIVSEWLSREPWCRYKDRISFRTAFLPSETNVVGDCRDKSIKEISILNSQFGWHGSDRYLITNDVFRQSDYVGNIPADYVIVAVNTDTYGGGGVYNEITTFAAHHPLAIELALHEGGHGFAGLGDEYYNPEDNLEKYYDTSVEPWEPNLTSLKHFELKWKTLYDEGKAGLLEGAAYTTKGMYRATDVCLMRVLKEPFCPACSMAVERKISEYLK